MKNPILVLNEGEIRKCVSLDMKAFEEIANDFTACDMSSVGIQDTQIARLAYSEAVERGLGSLIE